MSSTLKFRLDTIKKELLNRPKEEFKFTINSGSDSSFILPLSSVYGTNLTYDFIVEWGDGQKESVTGTSVDGHGVSHTYATASKEYQITLKAKSTIKSDLNGWGCVFGFHGTSGCGVQANRDKIISLDSPLTSKMIIRDGNKNNLFSNMFNNCKQLRKLDGFNLPQDIVGSVGNYFCFRMFRGCSSLTTLPEGLNLPQNITSAGNDCCCSMFEQCYGLQTLPEGFSLPQNITSVGAQFIRGMFYECEALTTLPTSFQLPQKIQTVGELFAYACFMYCTKLVALPSSFQLPPQLTSYAPHFCELMFLGCSKLKSGCKTFFGNLKLPLVEQCFDRTFRDCTELTDVKSITELPQLSIIPDVNNNCFENCPDLDLCPINWGGSLVITDKIFRITINSGYDSCFTLPMASLMGQGKDYDLFVDWGDGTPWENITGKGSNKGYTHNYSMQQTTYQIALRQGINYTDDWLKCFGFNKSNDGCNNQLNKDKLISVDDRILPDELFTRVNYSWEGSNAYAELFYGCTYLTSVADDFIGNNLYIGTDFARETFSHCFNLRQANITSDINIYDSLKNAYKETFAYCSKLTIDVKEFFHNVDERLTDTDFNTKGLFERTFLNCTSINTPIDLRRIPVLQHLNVKNDCFKGCNRSILEYCPTGWGGLFEGSTYPEIEEFRFTINSGDDSQFILPLSSQYSIHNRLTTYNMNVDWGDDQVETITGTTSYDHGITHNYVIPNKDYEITLTPAGSEDGWMCCLGFNRGISGCNNQSNRDKVKSINTPYTKNMIIRDNVLNYILSIVWKGCSKLQLLKKGFSLPQNITSVGTYFCFEMFSGCSSLTSLPTGFNLPKDIKGIVGEGFCSDMFFGCTSLTSLPEGFSLPQGITDVDYVFCYNMFSGCSSLTSLPTGFNLPKDIALSTGLFCVDMFSNCTSLTSLPDGFNLPQGMTTIGSNFCDNMFANCSLLTSLPDGFNLPQGIITVGSNFCTTLFNNCTNLLTLPTGFNLPQGMTSVSSNFCDNMFENCFSLTSLPNGFTLPHGITTVENSFCYNTFKNCISLKTGITNFFGQFTLPKEELNKNRVFYNCFINCASNTEEISPRTIPQLNVIPSVSNECFTGTPHTENCPPEWGGSVVSTELFKFTVNSGDDKQFILPLSSSYSTGNNLTTYNMNVDWGDGQKETITGTSSKNYGVAHAYPQTNTQYQITLTPTGDNLDGWGCQFGFDTDATNCNAVANKAKMVSLDSPLTKSMVFKEGSTDFLLTRMFVTCSNMIVGDSFNLPQDIEGPVGTGFCQGLFNGCSSLASLPTSFNLPQGITTVGDSFCEAMFIKCVSLTTLPESFNLPPHITSIGNDFCKGMFRYCNNLQSLSTSLSMPQVITDVPNGFGREMFQNCSSLTSLPEGFNLPQKVTTCGETFGHNMFSGCSSLVSLPNGFNLFQSIATVGGYFCASMFNNCTNLLTLPTGFNLPQSISTQVHLAFCSNMFQNCSSLTSLPEGFNLPQNSHPQSYFCTGMFKGCSSLASLPDGFSFILDTLPYPSMYGSMFDGCSSLTSLPVGVRIPQGVRGVYKQAYQFTFRNCSKLKTGIINFFGNTKLSAGELNKEGVLQECFANCTSLEEEISPETIPQLTISPTNPNNCFKGCPEDKIINCPPSWGGKVVVPMETFKYTIKPIPDTATGKYRGVIPFHNHYAVRGHITGFKFDVDWGDGQVEHINLTNPVVVNHTYENNNNYQVTLTSVDDSQGWMCGFGYDEGFAAEVKDMLISLDSPFTSRMMFRNRLDDLFDGNFNGCHNVTLSEGFNLPQDLPTTLGNTFCSALFTNCTSLTTLPSTMKLPQNIIKVGRHCFNQVFKGCTQLKTLSEGFNLPQNLQTCTDFFCNVIFSGCTSLTTLPNDFTLPPKLTQVGSYFCSKMFENCRKLTSLPSGFTFPQNLTTCGSEFGGYMFNNCTSLVIIPEGIQLPQRMTTLLGPFCAHMFHGCTSLQTLPASFVIPQSLTTVKNGFITGMFYNCYNLQSLPDEFNLPQKITSVGPGFCWDTFRDCRKLTTLASFQLPQKLTTVDIRFCRETFKGSGLQTGIINFFGQLKLSQTELNKTEAFKMTFNNCATNTETISADTIPQLTISPSSTHSCFAGTPHTENCPPNWK